jgi:hypothetical protein
MIKPKNFQNEVKRTKQFKESYEEAYHPHKLSKEQEFYSQVSKKKPKPDPATVEAELQREEELWNN